MVQALQKAAQSGVGSGRNGIEGRAERGRVVPKLDFVEILDSPVIKPKRYDHLCLFGWPGVLKVNGEMAVS